MRKNSKNRLGSAMEETKLGKRTFLLWSRVGYPFRRVTTTSCLAGLCLLALMGFTSAPPAKNLEKNSGFNPQMAGWPMASNMKLNEAYGKLPLYFEPNEGQIDPQVRFLTRGGRYALYLTPAEAVFVMKSPDPKTGGKIRKIKAGLSGHPFKKPEVLRLRLAGGNRLAVFEVLESAEGKSNYLIGNDSALWRTGVVLIWCTTATRENWNMISWSRRGRTRD
jgi:hypothetical protein